MKLGEKKLYKYNKFKFITILIIFFGVLLVYLKSPFTFIEDNKIINYALLGSNWEFKVKRVFKDSKERRINYKLWIKRKVSPEKFAEINFRMNKYLQDNPDYELNNDYIIELEFCANPSGGPKILKYSNVFMDKFNKKEVERFDGLYCLGIYDWRGWNNRFDMYQINNFENFKTLQSLMIESDVPVEDISIFSNFKSLKYFRSYTKLSKEQIKELKELLQDCKLDISEKDSD